MQPYRRKVSHDYTEKTYDATLKKPLYNRLVFLWINFFVVNIMSLCSFFFDIFIVFILFYVFIGIPLATGIIAICELVKVKKEKRLRGILILCATYLACFLIFQLQLNMYFNFYILKKLRTDIATSENVFLIPDDEWKFPAYPSGLAAYKGMNNENNVYFRIEYNGQHMLRKDDDPVIHRGFFYTESTPPNNLDDMDFDYIKKINERWYYVSSLRQ